LRDSCSSALGTGVRGRRQKEEGRRRHEGALLEGEETCLLLVLLAPSHLAQLLRLRGRSHTLLHLLCNLASEGESAREERERERERG